MMLAGWLAAADGVADLDALRAAFPQADDFVQQDVQATPPQLRAVLTAARSTARGKQGPVYAAMRSGTWVGTAYVDHVIGRTEYITWLCAVGRDDRIHAVRVLTYREAIGGEVAQPAWLRHFVGLSASDHLRRGKPIPNIGGATLSVDALTERCRLLLEWHTQVVVPALSRRYPTAPAEADTGVVQRAIPVGNSALTLRLTGTDAARLAPTVLAQATAAATAANAIINQWDSNSEAARLNAAGGGTVSAPLGRVMDDVARWHAASAGAFDPTIAPLVTAWAAADGGQSEPDAMPWRDRIGWSRIGWNGTTLRLPQGMTIDYGGVAKGWILDHVAAAIATQIPTGLAVHLDYGTSSQTALGNAPATIALMDPRHPGTTPDTPWQTVTLPAGWSFGASHSHGRTVTVRGVAHSHLIDPRTGRPLPTPRAAFVIAPTAFLADLLSTAVCVLDAPQALALAQQAGAQVLRWDTSGCQASPGWPGSVAMK